MAIQTDLNNQAISPVGDEALKPESEVMTMNVPPEMMEESVTPSTETKVEDKAPLEESLKEDEPSREDVKPVSDDEWTEEDQRHLSDRAQKRIRDLNEKANKAAELELELKKFRGESQKERFTGSYDQAIKQPLFTPANPPEDVVEDSSLGEQTPQTEASHLPWDLPPQEQQYEEKVLSPEEYQRDVLASADILVQARIAQMQKSAEIKSDLTRMEAKYPELNPDSSDYSEAISTKLANLFETQLRTNPKANLANFIDSIMTLREDKGKESEKKAKESLTARTIEQKAEEAITPHEIEAEPEKPYETLSIEEKESYLKDKGLWN